MDNLEFIEAYFNNELAPERKSEFDRRVISDTAFAEEVAFYLSSQQAAYEERNEERDKFKHLYKESKKSNNVVRHEPALLRRLRPWAAAAAILVAIAFGWYVWFKPVSPAEMANNYITAKFQKLPVEMGIKEDSLQAGMNLYNQGRPEQALTQFESLALHNTSFPDAKKYAGIVSLRLGQYDKAIHYFSQLSQDTLYANPGKFYHALTLMKRNQPGDKEMAKQLLQQVVENDLDKKKEAKEWLKKWSD